MAPLAFRDFLPLEGIPEGSTYLYRASLKDSDGNTVTAAQISTVAATLRDETTGGIINSRDDQDVKNVNGGTLTDGQFEFQFATEDMVIVGTKTERHVLTLDFGLVGGGRATHRVRFWVVSFEDI